MQISNILDYIDNGHMALPEFQRGYVWNRDQVRGLFRSLYRRHPVGGLLVWATESKGAAYRGDGTLAPGVVKLILDGQQRVTTLYGVMRGKPPKFFDGNSTVFEGLRFHLETETFAYYQPLKMEGDPFWVDVTTLMKSGNDGLGEFIEMLAKDPALAPKVAMCSARLNKLLGIFQIDLHVEEVTGKDKGLEEVVEIFNQVNSGGTKLSQGDLALAKICSDWPEGRAEMKKALKSWSSNGYHFNLDWLLRSVNTTLTGEAKFSFLHNKTADEVKDGLKRAVKRIDYALNAISGRLGLDHDQVLFGRFAIPVMVRYLDQHDGQLNAVERDKLLFWYIHSGMWGRFSGSTESFIDLDLSALEGEGDGLDKLLEQLRLWHGTLRALPGHFSGWSLGARFYPVLYMLTRMGEARDWGNGLPLKQSLLGKMNKLEVHHIFPKAQLYKHKNKYKRPQVNAVANFCFLTKDTNLDISDSLPEVYFPKVENSHPGALASQWIPMDPLLWKIENFPDFLDARRELLAAETNRQLAELLHGETHWMEGPGKLAEVSITPAATESEPQIQDEAITALNDWVEQQGLPRGLRGFDAVNGSSGPSQVLMDLAWPKGLQEELSEPVALVMGATDEALLMATHAGFKCFDSVEAFKSYVETSVLAMEIA